MSGDTWLKTHHDYLKPSIFFSESGDVSSFHFNWVYRSDSLRTLEICSYDKPTGMAVSVTLTAYTTGNRAANKQLLIAQNMKGTHLKCEMSHLLIVCHEA